MARWIVLVGTIAILAVPGGIVADERDLPATRSVPTDSCAAVTRTIDVQIGARLKSAAIPASPAADDAEFLRRLYLDLHGVVPPAEFVRSFLADRAAEKREKLIDQMLADPRFAAHLADLWDDYLIPASDDPRSDRQRLKVWLEEAFRNKSWDRIAKELLTASGQRDKNAAVTYLLKGRETLSPAELTDLVSQYFLGMRLNCAQCHDHPFAPWKQTDYWGMAAFFTEIQYTDRKLLKSGLIRDDPAVALDKLENGAKLRTPRFLGAGDRTLPPGMPPRQALAQWLTSADNPYFARAMVNRMWAQFFGRGLVEPVDDMHPQNPPTHPELLSELSERFVATGFDLPFLCRSICNSAAYQRTSRPSPGNERDATLYSHMAVKVLTPEQLYDSLLVVLPRVGEPKRSGRSADPREEFVQFFRSGGDANPTAYDRGIPQTLRMMNSPQFLALRNEGPTVQRIIEEGTSDSLAIERLYLHVLARQPTDDERGILKTFLSRHPGKNEQAHAEILWALLNSSEFSLNH
ncbi:MAG: DUF1549 and DUF1553 domain-containing protein [Planctomycetales bacterium]|nr:DUF1549 and DUF1553 domain-containing protein [Planctomycetales bacterium]